MFEKNPKWLTQKTDFFNSLNSQECFCFIPMKISQSFLQGWIEIFDDYHGFQPKTTPALKYATQCTVMRFSDLKETSTDIAADSTFEKFR